MEPLRELVKKWRTRGTHNWLASPQSRECANELEAALTQQPAAGEAIGHDVLAVVEAARRLGWKQSGGEHTAAQEAAVKDAAAKLSASIATLAHPTANQADAEDGVRLDELRADIQRRLNVVGVPKMTPTRAEYWKAGVRMAIALVDTAIDAARAKSDDRGDE